MTGWQSGRNGDDTPASELGASPVFNQRYRWSSRLMLHNTNMASPEPWKCGGWVMKCLFLVNETLRLSKADLTNPTQARNIGKGSRQWTKSIGCMELFRVPYRVATHCYTKGNLLFSYTWYLELLTDSNTFSFFLRSSLESRPMLSNMSFLLLRGITASRTKTYTILS